MREVWGEEFVHLLDEHLDRIKAHLGELDRSDLEAKVRVLCSGCTITGPTIGLARCQMPLTRLWLSVDCLILMGV